LDRVDSFNSGKKQRKQNFGAECTIADGQRQLKHPLYPVRSCTGILAQGWKSHYHKNHKGQKFFSKFCAYWGRKYSPKEEVIA
jgi:hypothetical protein